MHFELGEEMVWWVKRAKRRSGRGADAEPSTLHTRSGTQWDTVGHRTGKVPQERLRAEFVIRIWYIDGRYSKKHYKSRTLFLL